MKRLSLILTITVFAFLAIGQATAIIIYESSVTASFSSEGAPIGYHGIYTFEVFNEASGTDEEGNGPGNLWWFTTFFSDDVFGATMSTFPAPIGWAVIPIELNQMRFTISPTQFGVAPGASLGGFNVAVQFLYPEDPVPQDLDYAVSWSSMTAGSAQSGKTSPPGHTPEPATLLLIGGGLIAIAAGYIKKKKKV